MKREKEIKSFSLELKDMNSSTGEVSFYFAAWSKDQDNDIILKTAYQKTFSENTENIYHNRDHTHACGKPSTFGIDDKGAFCTSQLAVKTITGQDTYEQYKAGLIKGHSQEFETIKCYEDVSRSARIIQEVKLWGVTSITNIPSNLDTPIISLKSFEDVSLQMKKINDLLHNGNISDKLGLKFCEEYKRLQKFMESKSEALAAMGVVHCDNCKTIIMSGVQSDANNDSNFDNDENMQCKCEKCGRFINKRTGKSSLLSSEGIKNFKL